jgi:hypothetical protein
MKLTALNHSLLFEYKKSSDGKAILLHRRQGLPRVRDVLSCVWCTTGRPLLLLDDAGHLRG